MSSARPSRSLPTRAIVVSANRRIGSILVMAPAEMELTGEIKGKVAAFLSWRFPEEAFEVAPGLLGHDHGFVAIPMAGLVEEFEIKPLPAPTAQKLNEIADALEEFRVAGWKQWLN